ncbi:MAG: type II/IV secretion system protein [Planctomycetota bacterium]|nr:MAG: type II/IV secretion system protein [Planctomycetota bacterium]
MARPLDVAHSSTVPLTAVTARGDGLGALLLAAGEIEAEQLARAERVRNKIATPTWIGDVLVELGFVRRETLQEIFRRHGPQRLVGELLWQRGRIAVDVLERVLQDAERDRRPLVDRLLEQRVLPPGELVRTVCEAAGWPFVRVDPRMVDPKLLEGIALRYLLTRRVLPIAREQRRLSVASGRPWDPAQRRDMLQVFGVRELEVAGADPEAIADVLTRLGSGMLEDSGPRARLAPGEEGEGSDAHRARSSAAAGAQEGERVVALADAIVRRALEARASDIHIEPLHDRSRIRFRIDGVLQHHSDLPLELHRRLAARFKVLSGSDVCDRLRHQDGRMRLCYDGQELDVRVSFFVTVHGEAVVMRLLRKCETVPSLAQLGMAPAVQQRYLDEVLLPLQGVVIATGPTGSGKTTTLYSSLATLCDERLRIVTVEDPVEYQLPGVTQCQVSPRAGRTFASSLRAIVRQDPDVIVIGEVRDVETADTAIEAALTGHKVLTTLHTEDSVGGLVRLLNMDLEAFLVSSAIVGIVAQRLVRKVCAQCKAEIPVGERDLERLGLEADYFRGRRLVHGRGCAACDGTGYRGRVGLFELLVLNAPLRDAVLRKEQTHGLRRIGLEEAGLVTLLEDGIMKAVQGRTTLEEVLRRVPRTVRPRPLAVIERLAGFTT